MRESQWDSSAFPEGVRKRERDVRDKRNGTLKSHVESDYVRIRDGIGAKTARITKSVSQTSSVENR